MQLDQQTLSRLLTMNDEQLSALVRKLAADAGIQPSELGLDSARIQAIREALGSVTDRDLESLNGIYRDFRASQGDRGTDKRR